MKIRSMVFRLMTISVMLIIIAACSPALETNPPPAEVSPAPEEPGEIIFAAERTTLAAGECTWLRWEAAGGFVVTLDGEGVPAAGDREVCPTETRIYRLEVDMGTRLETRQVEVVINPAPPAIEQVTAVPELPAVPAYQAAIWKKMDGPAGGLGYDIRMDPTNPDIMFVTDSFAGIMKSTDGGRTWVPSNSGIDPLPGPVWKIFSATIDPFDHNTIWIGTQDTGHIYRSTDGGETWHLRDTGLLTTEGIRSVRGITIDPNNREVVYAGVEVWVDAWSDGTTSLDHNRMGIPVAGEVYKSLDSGASWTRIWQGDSLARYIWVDPRNSDRIFVSTGIFDRDAANANFPKGIGGGIGILRSDDGGRTWTILDEKNGLGGLYIPSLFMHPEDPDTLVAAVTTVAGCILASSQNIPCDSGNAGVFVTHNGGETWRQVISQPGKTSMDAVEISVSNPQIWYAATESQIFRSEDAGNTWKEFFMGSPERKSGMPIDLQVDPRNPFRIFVNNYGGGNFISENGGETWQDASAGYSGAIVWSLALPPGSATPLFAGADTATFRSDDGGRSWQGAGVAMAPAVLIATEPGSSNYIIFSTTSEQGYINTSRDGGETWTQINVSPIGAAHYEMRALAVAPSDPQVIFTGFMAGSCPGTTDTIFLPACDAAAPGLFRSQNGGLTWAKVPEATFDQTVVTAAAIHPNDPQNVFIATGKGLFHSTDQGETWQLMKSLETSAMNTLGIGANDFTIRGAIIIFNVAFDPVDPSTLFASTYPGILFRSQDGGSTWEQVINGLQPADFVFAILPDPNHPGVFYIGTTSSGVLYTTDGGDSWQPTGGSTSYLNIRSLALSQDGSILYAGTLRSGLWLLGTSTTP